MSRIPPFSILRRCRNLFRRRDGLSLIEVLVALSMTLVILVAMMRAFKFASEQMSKGRASLEMTNRIRTVQNLLKSDLKNLTVEVKPYAASSDEPKGYFELIDGVASDATIQLDNTGTPNVDESTVTNLMVGDFDDIIAFTVKSQGRPFRGRVATLAAAGNAASVAVARTVNLESAFAEVVWFTTYTDNRANGTAGADDGIPEPVNGDQIRLYRKQLLIVPDAERVAIQAEIDRHNYPTLNDVGSFFRRNELSARVIRLGGGGFSIQLNRLEDLDIRGYRFGHIPPVNRPLYPQERVMSATTFLPLALADNGQDLMLTELLGFDLRVFAPQSAAWVRSQSGAGGGNLVAISEIGEVGANAPERLLLNSGTAATFIAETNTSRQPLAGSFVDLGHLGNALASDPLERSPNQLNVLAGGTANLPAFNGGYSEFVYDTGTPWYNKVFYPPGANGIDDDGDGIVDDFGSVNALGVQTSPSEKIHPPYSVPLRGIEVTVRAFEPASGQVTQMTSRTSFIAD